MHAGTHDIEEAPRNGRRNIHDSPVQFRASAALVDAAKSVAAIRSMSLAEFMRHAMRRELETALAATPAPSSKLSQADTNYKRAAHGDHNAQRGLVLDALVAAAHPLQRHEALREAEHWARMAALTGSDEDHARLVSILAMRIADSRGRGDIAAARGMEAEGIALVSVLADEGNQMCAETLPTLADEADAEIMAHARALVASWKAAS